MINRTFQGSGTAFFEGVDDAGFEGGVLVDRFDRFGTDLGLTDRGGAIAPPSPTH